MNGYGWEPAEHQLRLLSWPQSGSGELANADKWATQQGGKNNGFNRRDQPQSALLYIPPHSGLGRLPSGRALASSNLSSSAV